MKKILSLLLCGMILLQLSACTKLEVTPASEVAAIRNDAISYPDGQLEYDNEKSAKTLWPVRKKTVSEKSHGLISEIENYNLRAFSAPPSLKFDFPDYFNGHFLLRYNYGKYYAVAKMTDGSYCFTLFIEAKHAINYCFVKRLAPIEKVETIEIGDTLKEVKRKTKNTIAKVDSSGKGEVWRVISSNLITQFLHFKDGKLTEIVTLPAEESVLTYLLPQDLALIS